MSQKVLDENRLLSDGELADILQVSRSTISRGARDGRLFPNNEVTPVYINGIRRWKASAVASFLRAA
jgi:predicted DNA-binding transcriptional regulator AlpA